MVDESLIRRRAYELWARDGNPADTADTYWHLAVSQLEYESHALVTDEGDPVPATVEGVVGSDSDYNRYNSLESDNSADNAVTVPAQRTGGEDQPDDLIGDA